MGHLNQCIAYAKIIGADYTIVEVLYVHRLYKLLSYFLDRIHVWTDAIFECHYPAEKFDAVIGAGSTSIYPLKVISKRLKIKSVSMMLPKGYHLDIDVIFAQTHDNPPKAKNIIEIPANFSYITPPGIFRSVHQTIGIVIGGDNKVFHFSPELLKKQLDTIFQKFQGYQIAVTTSPRTSSEIEALLDTYPFDYKVIYSQNPINPIPDFLDQCEYVFITQDSTSMISEAVSFGKAYIEVLPLKNEKENKFSRLVNALEKGGYLHLFDGSVATANGKIDFYRLAREGL